MHVNNQGNGPLRGSMKRTVFPAVCRVAFRAVDPLWSVFRENDGVGAEEREAPDAYLSTFSDGNRLLATCTHLIDKEI